MEIPSAPKLAHAHDESASRGALPQPTHARWFHVMFNTFGTWLRGDARGFRDHDHRIHTSGDYHSPPPAGEHRALREWCRDAMHKPPVRLTPEQQRIALRALLIRLRAQHVEVIALAVMPDHVHMLARLGSEATKVVGRAKAASSHALRRDIPGAVWGRRALLKPIRDRAHHGRVFGYIVGHAREGAVVWTFRDPIP